MFQPPLKKKPVSFFKLQYSLSKGKDCLYVLIACIGAIGTGIAMPLFAIIFGGTINGLRPEEQANPDSFKDTINDLCLKFVYIGLGMWASGFINLTFWNYNGKTIAKRIKKRYFRTIMLQEQGYFDQCNTYEFATKIQSQIKTIEQGVNNYLNNFRLEIKSETL